MKTKLTEDLNTVIYRDLNNLITDFISTQVTRTINRFDVINGPRHYELDFKNNLGIAIFINQNNQFSIKYLKKEDRGDWYISNNSQGNYSELLNNIEKFVSLESNKLLYLCTFKKQ